jgi:GNAT superfamily N-acetyltransferase
MKSNRKEPKHKRLYSGQSKYKIVNSSKLTRIRIDEKLVAFNRTQVPFTQRSLIHLGFCIKRGRNDYWAGINAYLYSWNIAHVDILWVDETLRGQGVGSELLRKVEDKAKERGCKLIHLDTFDFQAKGFYLKQGYKVFGKLKDCPDGHVRYYLQKRL